MYVEERFHKMKKKVNPIYMMIGMVIRIALILALFGGGKLFFNWAINLSHNTTYGSEVKNYTKSKLRAIKTLRAEGFLTDEELKARVQEVHEDPKGDYIKEMRSNE